MVTDSMRETQRLRVHASQPILIKGIVGGSMAALLLSGGAQALFHIEASYAVEGAIALVGGVFGAVLALKR